MTHDEIIAVIQAHKEGGALRDIQIRVDGRWLMWEPKSLESLCGQIGRCEQFRIKPTPKLRPWKPEEVPVGAQMRGKSPYGTFLIMECNPDGLAFVNALCSPSLTRIPFLSALENYVHSTDGGKTWKPCGVEE